MSAPFTCPHCGATTDVADEQVGQTCPCGSHCGKNVDIPSVGGGAPKSNGQFWSNFFKPSCLGCFIPAIILIDIIGVGIGQFLPGDPGGT